MFDVPTQFLVIIDEFSGIITNSRDETRASTNQRASPVVVGPSPTTMSSPIALKSSSPSSSIFGRKKQSVPLLAAQYLQAVSHADSIRRSSSTIATTLTDLDSNSTNTLVDSEDSGEDLLNVPVVPPNSEQVFHTRHIEFGHCADERFRHVSQHTPGKPLAPHKEQDPPYYILLSTYLSYVILICIGHVRDFFGKRLRTKEYSHLMPNNVRLISQQRFPC
jgi:serine palmitoyltransferase